MKTLVIISSFLLLLTSCTKLHPEGTFVVSGKMINSDSSTSVDVAVIVQDSHWTGAAGNVKKPSQLVKH